MIGNKLWPYYLYVEDGTQRRTFLCMSREGARACYGRLKRHIPNCTGYALRVSESEASIMSLCE